MVSIDVDSFDFEDLAGVVAVLTLPAAALTYILLGSGAAGVVGVVGWLLLVPLFGVLDDSFSLDLGASGEAAAEPAREPVDRLRTRYVEGEIEEAEFERRLERLLETEDAEVPEGVDRRRPTEGTHEEDEPVLER